MAASRAPVTVVGELSPAAAGGASRAGDHGLVLQVHRLAPGTVVLQAVGPLTTATRECLRRSLRAVSPSQVSSVLVDCSAVSDADPAGVAVLLVAARAGRALGRDVRVVHPSAPMRSLLQRVGAATLLADDGGGR